MRPLTVVQLLPALHSGGVERSTLEIADALVRAGHRAIVVSAGGRLVAPLEALGARHVTLDIGRKSPLVIRHVRALRRLFAETGADLVHARSRLPAWLGLWALRGMPAATRPRFVTTVHGLNSPSRYSAVMTRGERVICVSATVRDYVLQHYPSTDPTRLRVIPRGIDPQAFPAVPVPDHAARARWAVDMPALAGDGPLLLMPGRGTRLKGHDDALALLARLRARGLDARLWMPGAREPGRERYLADLERTAADAGCADALAITPPVADIAAAYAACDLVLQLSRKPEAFGRTVIEAHAVGRPVLGWAHGGVGELLRELQPDGAVSPFDPDALVAGAERLLARAATDPVTMTAPADRLSGMPSGMPPSVSTCASRYSLAAMQRATLDCYQDLVDDPRREH